MELLEEAGGGALAFTEDVSLVIDQRVATITVTRPSKINAMRLTSWQQLRAHVIAADTNPAVDVILVRGAGKHFGAGNDIAALSTFHGNRGDALVFGIAWASAIQAVEDSAKPVLMAIDGVCYGAALALSLAGDVRLASGNAVFSIPVAALGALYLRSDYQRLVETIGMGQSKKLIYSSKAIGAVEALQIGLVDEVFAQECFEEELASFVATVRTRSPFTLQRSKAMLRDLCYRPRLKDTHASLIEFAESTQSADFREGISAFLERRTACFSKSGSE